MKKPSFLSGTIYVDLYTDFSKQHSSLTGSPVVLIILFSIALQSGSTNGIVTGLPGILIQFVLGTENFIYPIGNFFN